MRIFKDIQDIYILKTYMNYVCKVLYLIYTYICYYKPETIRKMHNKDNHD